MSGGKPGGQPNKYTRELWSELKRLGMGTTWKDPVVFLADVYTGRVKQIAMGAFGPIKDSAGNMLMIEASIATKVFAADKVANFLYPKLKAVEFKALPVRPPALDPAQLPTAVLQELRNQVKLQGDDASDGREPIPN